MSTATQPGRLGPGFAIYVTIAAVLLVFSIIAGFSIGLFILPIPLVMFVSIGWWNRPWIVAGFLSAAVALSFAYLGTAPLRCGISGVKEHGRPPVEREWCIRLFLTDIEGRSSRPSDAVLALSIAAAAASIAGVTGARIARAVTRRTKSAL